MSASDLMRGVFPVDSRNPVWVINFAAKGFQHALAWNTHDLVALRGKEPHAFQSFYREHDRPLVTLAPVPDCPAYLYPLKDVAEFWQDRYFFAAPAYMLAYAAWCRLGHENPEPGLKGFEIRLFGLDFDYPNRTDYEAGRACTEYWMGRLRSLGCKFTIPNESSLLDLAWQAEGGRMRGYGWPFYGYFDNQPKLNYDAEGRFTLDHDPLGHQDQRAGEDQQGNERGLEPVLVHQEGGEVRREKGELHLDVSPEHSGDGPGSGLPAHAQNGHAAGPGD